MVPAARCVPSSDHACTDPARLQAAEAMFKDMDTDGNGALDTMEFQCKCSDFGLDDASIQRLFLQLDTNSDGQISLDEFTAGWAKFQEAQGGGSSEGAGPTEVPFGESRQFAAPCAPPRCTHSVDWLLARTQPG